MDSVETPSTNIDPWGRPALLHDTCTGTQRTRNRDLAWETPDFFAAPSAFRQCHSDPTRCGPSLPISLWPCSKAYKGSLPDIGCKVNIFSHVIVMSETAFFPRSSTVTLPRQNSKNLRTTHLR